MDASMIPVSIHRLIIALLDAVDAGFLAGKTWVVEVDDDPVLISSLLSPYLRLCHGMGRLWGPDAVAEEPNDRVHLSSASLCHLNVARRNQLATHSDMPATLKLRQLVF